ncbi:MAG TPA: hypothetical protein VFP72_15440 [Kineosporiaceae bacterium]|nr:hypothetical protein [Kineosporiaceae bacterium]
MGDQADADPVSIALAHLRTDSTVLAAFGGADHISGLVEAPWPHLRVTQGPGGSLRDLRWALTSDVILEVYGAPDGSPGDAEMRRLGMRAVLAVKALQDKVYGPAEPVVSRVVPATNLAPSPVTGVGNLMELATGQSRWTATLTLTLRPPA